MLSLFKGGYVVDHIGFNLATFLIVILFIATVS